MVESEKHLKAWLAYGSDKAEGEFWDAPSVSFTWTSGNEENYSTALWRNLRKSI